MKPDVRAERIYHDEAKKVDVVFHVDHGPQYLFGRLNVEGLDLVAEAEVRRLWALKAGAPFDAGYPDYFLSRMREDGVFDNLGKTRSSIKLDEAARDVDVTLTFQGASKPASKPR